MVGAGYAYALCAWMLATDVAAFDYDAHDAIGQTAASAMDQPAVRQMKRLLGGQDASDVAGWGHQADETYPGMKRLHFQVHDDSAQPFCSTAKGRAAKCDDNICLLTAIKHFYGKVLEDEGRRIEYPKIDYSKASKGIRFTDADSVKMLINLLGDLHQPLHVGFASDENGAKIQVRFRGKTMSLYDFWDKGISETVRAHEANFWLGGWTHVRAISGEFNKDKELWQKEGPFQAFESWLEDTVQLACKKVYTHPSTGKKLGGPDAVQGVIDIDETAYQEWRETWLRQILIAGERTAIVMNDILDAGGAGKLHDGTGVKTKADEEKAKEMAEWEKERVKLQKEERAARGGTGTPFHLNPRVIATNLGIAAVTVPIFLLVANVGLNPVSWVALATALLNSLESSNKGASGSAAGGGPTKRWE